MIDFNRRMTENGTLVIQATGRLDGETNDYFFGCVKDEIEAGNKKIVINFDGLGHVSSVGLGSLQPKRKRSNRLKRKGFIDETKRDRRRCW